MKEKIKYIPNFITALRIVGTASLLLTKPMSLWFYVVYLFTGLTDILDGFIARKFKLTSDFGAKLDSVADLLFYAVMLIMIFPVLLKKLPAAIWWGVALVLCLRLAAYITAAVKFRRFSSTHSILNKITGACVFAIPFIMKLPFAVPVCWAVCFVGGLGSFEELVRHLKNHSYSKEIENVRA